MAMTQQLKLPSTALNGTTLEEEAIKSGLIDKKTFTDIVRPEKMINPTIDK